MKQIKVGVVGLGVGEQHARAINANPHCKLECVYDLDFERAHQIAEKMSECGVANSYSELLSKVDAVSIASFDDDHYSQIMEAISVGKHVFVEKPVCRTLAELRAVKAAWMSAGGRLKFRSNLVLRAAPLYLWLKQRIDSGDFGRIYSFDGDYLYGRLHKITEGWRKNVTDYSVMEGGGIHLVDLMLWLTKERPSLATAAGNAICTEGTDFRYNDFTAATFEFPSGMISRITANYGCVHRHQHAMRIFGTKATFLYDDQGPRWFSTRDPAISHNTISLSALPSSKGDLISSFVKAIIEDTDDRASTESFFDGISLCVAADRAAITGMRERINYV